MKTKEELYTYENKVYEEAFNMIIEAGGTQFDPSITAVLMTIKDEFINASK